MKKIIAINSLPYGSTGNIMINILHTAKKTSDYEGIAFYGRWKKKTKPDDIISSEFGFASENIASALLSKITGMHNIGSIIGTMLLIKKIKKINPDIIHLHNLHLWVINLPLLFRYLKSSDAKVVWTLHDCWAFTGQCPHFTMVNCQKWKTGCYSCPQFRDYPGTYFDQTRVMWKLKKKWFNGVGDMTLVAPSKWLKTLVKQSYMKDYPVKVIYNGINLNNFKPIESDFRKKHQLEDKFIVLGVALGWGERKGLDIFIELSQKLDDKYKIILVGTDEKVDKQLNSKIVSIHRTKDQYELAQIYTAADVFVNPTREEVLGLVNIESLACGTPVITFDTGGSPECIDSTCGQVVECDDKDAILHEIRRVCETKPYSAEACMIRSKEFDMNNRFSEYVALYQELLDND